MCVKNFAEILSLDLMHRGKTNLENFGAMPLGCLVLVLSPTRLPASQLPCIFRPRSLSYSAHLLIISFLFSLIRMMMINLSLGTHYAPGTV